MALSNCWRVTPRFNPTINSAPSLDGGDIPVLGLRFAPRLACNRGRRMHLKAETLTGNRATAPKSGTPWPSATRAPWWSNPVFSITWRNVRPASLPLATIDCTSGRSTIYQLSPTDRSVGRINCAKFGFEGSATRHAPGKWEQKAELRRGGWNEICVKITPGGIYILTGPKVSVQSAQTQSRPTQMPKPESSNPKDGPSFGPALPPESDRTSLVRVLDRQCSARSASGRLTIRSRAAIFPTA